MRAVKVVVFMGLLLMFYVVPAMATELSVGIADHIGNFTLKYQKYEVEFQSEGIGLLGAFAELRFLENKLGVGTNYIAGKYKFKGSGTTADDEELDAEGTRNRKDLDIWLRFAPSRHFSVLAGYKSLDFDFRDVHAVWTVPEGKELEGTADVTMSGLSVGIQASFGRRLIGVISLAYYPSLSGDVSWDGRKREPDKEWEVDKGSSTVTMQGFKFQFNVVKPFPDINSALTLGYYLQVVADEFETINYRTDELFTGIMISFSYTFRFGDPTEVEADSPFETNEEYE